MKKTIALIIATGALALSPMVFAVGSNGSGLFIRGQVGYDMTAGNTKDLKKKDDKSANNSLVNNNLANTTSASDSSKLLQIKDGNGMTARIAAGYDFNKYLGIEVGFQKLHAFNRAYPDQKPTASDLMPTKYVDKTSYKTSLWAADIMGKVTIPLGKFYAFAGAGAAYVHETTSLVDPGFNPDRKAKNATTSHIRPEFGIGAGYMLSDHMSVDVEYTRIMGTGNINDAFKADKKSLDAKNPLANLDKSYMPSINTFMVGLTYKF